MKILNIILGKKVQQLRYEYDAGVYSFEEDLKVGDWIVSRIIKVCGPSCSVYKYDFKNYFEFAITDCHGESRILTWNHNAGDNNLKAYWSDSEEDAIPFFFANHPIFSSKDWKDYESVITLKAIERIIQDKSISSGTKVLRITSLIKKSIK